MLLHTALVDLAEVGAMVGDAVEDRELLSERIHSPKPSCRL